MEDINKENYLKREILSKKSWTAYATPSVILLILLVIFSSIHFILGLIVVFFIIVTFLNIRSYELFIDSDGVWLYRGIFPWNKGIHGVKWRDLDEAVYYTGFLSWSLKSYTIKISHRFTKDGEIRLTHMNQGNTAVQLINSMHRSHVK